MAVNLFLFFPKNKINSKIKKRSCFTFLLFVIDQQTKFRIAWLPKNEIIRKI